MFVIFWSEAERINENWWAEKQKNGKESRAAETRDIMAHTTPRIEAQRQLSNLSKI